MGLFDKKDQACCYTFEEHTIYIEDRYGNVYEETIRRAIPDDNCSQQNNSNEIGAKVVGSLLGTAILGLF